MYDPWNHNPALEGITVPWQLDRADQNIEIDWQWAVYLVDAGTNYPLADHVDLLMGIWFLFRQCQLRHQVHIAMQPDWMHMRQWA